MPELKTDELKIGAQAEIKSALVAQPGDAVQLGAVEDEVDADTGTLRTVEVTAKVTESTLQDDQYQYDQWSRAHDQAEERMAFYAARIAKRDVPPVTEG